MLIVVFVSSELDREQLFNDLVKFYSKLFPQKNQKIFQGDVCLVWERIKQEHRNDDNALRRAVDEARTEWKQKCDRSKCSAMYYFKNPFERKAPKQDGDQNGESSGETSIDAELKKTRERIPTPTAVIYDPGCATKPPKQKKVQPTPKQDEIKEKIEFEKDILLGLHKKRDKGMMSSKDWEELRKREKTLDELKKSLRGRELRKRRQQKHHDGRKRTIDGHDEGNWLQGKAQQRQVPQRR